MKKLIISFIISLTLISFVRCSDDETYIEPSLPKQTTLKASIPEELYIGSLTGNKDGAIEGLLLEEYRDRYHEKLSRNNITDLFNLSSITFTELSDSVEIRGYINFDYLNKDHYTYVYRIHTNFAKFNYKFENGAFMINISQNKEEKSEWMILGYGDKNKIEVYIDSKVMRSGFVLEADGSYTSEMGYSSFTSQIGVDPDEALANAKNHNWNIFFDEISTIWTRISIMTSWAETWGTVESLKIPNGNSSSNRYMGVSWRIIKVTYTISE